MITTFLLSDENARTFRVMRGTLSVVILSPSDAERLADAILDEAGVDPSQCTPTPEIARRILGPSAVQIVPRSALRSLGALTRTGDRWRVVLRRGLPPELIGHVVGHELAHWAGRRHGVQLDEEDCDWIGAALVVPKRFVRSVIIDRVADVAKEASTTQSLVALRVGEALEVPLALVAPLRIRVRGPEEWHWPDADTIRRWARRPVDVVRPIRLTDGSGRVVRLFQPSSANWVTLQTAPHLLFFLVRCPWPQVIYA